MNEEPSIIDKSRRARIEPPLPEFGDARDVQRHFGIRESHLYGLMNRGLVKTS